MKTPPNGWSNRYLARFDRWAMELTADAARRTITEGDRVKVLYPNTYLGEGVVLSFDENATVVCEGRKQRRKAAVVALGDDRTVYLHPDQIARLA